MKTETLKALAAKALNVTADRIMSVVETRRNDARVEVQVDLTNGERKHTAVLLADAAATESKQAFDALPSTARLAKWTDSGTHGMPDTVVVYLRKDGRYDVIRYHGAGYIGTETVSEYPANASRHGTLRKVAMTD